MVVYDYAKILSCQPKRIVVPKNKQSLINIVTNNYRQPIPNKISIAGAKFSHGGHTLVDNGLYINMELINEIFLNQKQKRIRVGGGAIWYNIVAALDKYNLSVAEMQSYSNFSVGGSISVNCHGRTIKYGAIYDTIIELELLLANGKTINITKDHELFGAVIGGYGFLGIVLSATLIVEDNYKIKRNTKVETIKNYDISKYMQNENIVFYNANVYNRNKIMSVYYTKTNNVCTTDNKIQDKYNGYYWKTMAGEQILRLSRVSKYLKQIVEPHILSNKGIIWKNYEMTYDVQKHEPVFRWPSTTILQEYFVPIIHTNHFLMDLIKIINDYRINLLNLSIRIVKKQNIVLNYAKEDSASFVMYFNIGNNGIALKYCEKWTQELTQIIQKYNGSYYLPYYPFATVKQFKQIYPNWTKMMDLKKVYDEKRIFDNLFTQKYLI